MKGITSFWIQAVILFVLAGCSAMGQGVRFGVKGGVNVSDFYVRTNAYNGALKNVWKPLVLSNIGVAAEKRFSTLLGLQGEVLYTINGSNLQFSKSYAHFLSIPIVLNIRPAKWLVLEVGPQGSFIYKSKKSVLFINTDFDLSAVIGCRIQASSSLDIGLRFVQGIAPLGLFSIAENNGNIKNVHDFYNRNLQLSASYWFGK
ncbi:outer membrane beta-barrel protein [Dyadobacter sandarakinus]|uniref:PorT family protein n=1 Tax=Dyadobacter sandarakinus TaxID=2747268 RepID=A0ABX7I9Z0_9BACT|nr:outer membrane beta-barrel protein [Dyadobacter sandarakinus]QRR02730.1 PorT family protein [Dyadobacter sandarakinus]